MQHSFMQRVVMTVMAGVASAGLIWTYRNIVEKSRYENAEGWREIFKATPTPRRS